MADTNLDIQVNDSQAEQLIRTVNNLVDALGKLERESKSVAKAVDDVCDEADCAEEKVDDLGKASNRSSSSLLNLGGSASNFGKSLKSMTLAVGVGIVAIAGLDSIGAALQTTFDFVKDSVEALGESGTRMGREITAVKANFAQARIEFAKMFIEIIGGEEAISQLNLVAVSLADTMRELAGEFSDSSSIIVPLVTNILNMATVSAQLYEVLVKITNSTLLVGEGFIFVGTTIAALSSGPLRGAVLIEEATQRLERRTLELANSNDRAAETADALAEASRNLNTRINENSESMLTVELATAAVTEQFGLLGRLLTGQATLFESASSSVSGYVNEVEAAINRLVNPITFTTFDIADMFWEGVTDGIKNPALQEQADEALLKWQLSFEGELDRAREALIAFARGMSADELIREFSEFLDLSERAEELLRTDRSVFPDLVRRNVLDPIFSTIREGGQEIIDEIELLDNQLASQSVKLDNFTLFPYKDEVPGVIGQLEALGDQIEELDAYYDLLASIAPEEMLPRVEDARVRAIGYITDQMEELLGYYDAITTPLSITDAVDLARLERAAELAERVKKDLEPKEEPAQDSGIEFRPLFGGAASDRERMRDDLVSEQELWQSLTRAERTYFKDLGANSKQVAKTMNEHADAVREAFKDEAINQFSETLGGFAEYAGQALAGVVDDQLSATEKAKKLIGTFFGDFLSTIGRTAIAQGAIISISDPLAGGKPNPARGAALIAAGLAATVAGAAISGKAGAVGQKKDKKPTATPASTPGPTRGASTTNVFIQNQFGNRFDARELDRSAAQTFAAAAAQGQI